MAGIGAFVAVLGVWVSLLPGPQALASGASHAQGVVGVAPLASDVLSALRIRIGREVGGYVRSAFGQAWADVDRNGCDTRNDVLRRDLTQVVIKSGTRGCTVLSGVLADPYGGRSVVYVKGGTMIEVDHVVSLADAWRSGASRWDAKARTRFANDPLELATTTAVLNRAKGDKGAAGWLPPSVGYRCTYVARQIAVKAAYSLTVTATERAGMAKVLASCPGQPLPPVEPVPPLVADPQVSPSPSLSPTPGSSVSPTLTAGPTTTVVPTPTPTPTRSPTSTPTPTPTPSVAPTSVVPPAPPPQPPQPPAEAYYPNCAAARAAGVAPIMRGQPGYRPGLDRDGDGIACE